MPTRSVSRFQSGLQHTKAWVRDKLRELYREAVTDGRASRHATLTDPLAERAFAAAGFSCGRAAGT